MYYTGIFLFSLMLFSTTANAAPCPKWVAKAVSIQGAVELRQSSSKVTSTSKSDPNSAKRWLPVKRGDTFCANDVVRVKANSRAALILTNDTILRLDENSTITFSNLSANRDSQVNLTQGIAHFISRVKRAFEVVTPFVNAAIEGTEFVVAVGDKQTDVTVFEGKVRVSNTAGEVLLTKNQTASAKKGQSPQIVIKLKPRDAVQWALYYPKVIDTGTVNINRLINHASNMLNIGRVEEALSDINNVLKSTPRQTEALALKAIIALVNNDKVKAFDFATRAYDTNQQNISAILAMSYVQQAQFNIPAALKTLSNFKKSNALVNARLAEVRLMLGQLEQALFDAKQAVNLNADSAKAQTVLGFAYLTQINTYQAERSFNNAIELEQIDPLPHLGLGLALIRQGQLENGRREIEYAASLDPNNALIRSYLGKAYYEEKRNKVATDQFDMAKDLDTKDPTAWFYSAIQKQSSNRPVEALQDLQKSVELNDNRAVYRSRLLLDEDQAARNSGLARIYNDLGFEQLAQQQAFNSINSDYSNYSAHRFLAESYASRSRHEIGRVSELLQSQLLAPINITPVAPHLSETELGIQPNAGPGGASFNQYDPLFARNQSRIQASALAGTNKTTGDELVYSQLFDNTSLSLGQYHFETDGFRVNNDYKQDILNAFLHTNLTSNQSLQFEVKKNEKKNGDLSLRFDPTSFSTNRREKRDESNYRLGYHNKVSQTSDLIASIVQRNTLSTRDDKTAIPSSLYFSVENRIEDSKALTAELQYIQKKISYDYIVGISKYHNKNNASGSTKIVDASDALIPGTLMPINGYDRKSTNAYFYTHWHALHNLTLTFGLSNDVIDAPIYATKQTNPKVGLQWDVSSNTRLRLAGFRTLKRELIGNQTLEPTQVAGFNQYLDDSYATDAVNYGLALEHRLNKKIFSGIELLQRTLISPYASGSNTLNEGQTEYAGRLYLNWTPNNIVSLTTEFQYEDFARERVFENEPDKLITRKVPVSLKLHYPNGWSGSLTTSYYDQDVIQNSQHAEDNFWITDMSLGYRLPKRLGQINVEVRNLSDQKFKYHDASFRTGMALPATIYHERSIWLRLAFTFD